MQRPSPTASVAAFAAAGLGVVLGVALSTGGPERRDARLLVLALAVALLVAAARAATAATPLSRLTCAALSVAAVLGALLTLTVGVPGSPPTATGPASWAVIVLGAAVPLLLVLDVARSREPEHPYAP
ncbi:MAG TPA: hypothetical protein VFO49_15635 [Nocardioides sp.]|nr:hypothetical protein [Nocardioides sp.]